MHQLFAPGFFVGIEPAFYHNAMIDESKRFRVLTGLECNSIFQQQPQRGTSSQGCF